MNYQFNKIELHAGTARMEELESLVGLGYGATKNDVCEYLLSRQLDDLLRAGIIKRIGDDGRRR